MANSKKNIDFTYDGVKYKGIEAYFYSDTNISVTVTGTSKMIRQWVDSKYPKFSGRGISWVKSRKFAGGDAIDVYFNRIPEEYIIKIIKELDIFEYYDGHNYKRGSIDTSLGTISVGTKYLHVNNYPPYDSKEKDQPAPDWEKILKNASPTTSGGRSSGRSNFEWGDLVTECAGWKLYVKAYQDTFVYNLVKDKETPQNRESWGEIQGDIYMQTGFKWTKKTQTFSKWGLITDVNEVSKKLCEILLKYYTPKNEPTPTPQPEPKSKPLLTNDEVGEIAKSFADYDEYIWDELKIKSGGQLYNDISLQENYVIRLEARIINYMKKDLFNLFINAEESQKRRVYNVLENENYHSLNNFLGLMGYFGETKRKEYQDYFESQKDLKFKTYLNPAFFPKPDSTPTSNRKFEVGDKFVIVDDDIDIVYEVNSIKNNNIYLNWTNKGGDIINDFLWISEVSAKNEWIDKGRIKFIDEPTQTTPTSDRATIENQIKALNLVLKYPTTDENTRIIENQIKALNITLKYTK